MPVNIDKCIALSNDLRQKTYFQAAYPAVEQKYTDLKNALIRGGVNPQNAGKTAYIDILKHLHDVMREAQPLVEQAIQSRIQAGEIHNADQARKSAAGNIFQQFFAYLLAQNVICGNITAPVIVATSVKELPNDYAAIYVDGDKLMPDSDVIVYSRANDNSPIIVFSCKTSFRERAGQTYKWKLMCDLATCTCQHRKTELDCPISRYNITYTPTRSIKICFVTTDFYNEISNPQIISMFRFFDRSYIAKDITNATIDTLDLVIDYINSVFS